jgi:hypothetical protein
MFFKIIFFVIYTVIDCIDEIDKFFIVRNGSQMKNEHKLDMYYTLYVYIH